MDNKGLLRFNAGIQKMKFKVESYIGIDEERDEFNILKAKLNWDISFKTWSTTIKIADIITAEFIRLKLGKVELYPSIKLTIKVGWKTYPTSIITWGEQD